MTSSLQATRPAVGRDWGNISFIAIAHALALTGLIYIIAGFSSWWTVGLGVLWAILCGVSITGGYHRLFAHKSYEAAWPLRVFYLFFGAASVQNSALKWSGDHRLHHVHTDEDLDPYNIKRGFWWAHILWIFQQDDGRGAKVVRDLARDPLVRFQDRYYIPLAVAAGVLLPALLGSLWGDALGAVLVAGFLRLVIQWHSTFCVNSVAHTIGTRPYAPEISARDSFWTALITLGEGYHNFHHRFQLDYRNGVRWWQLDPTKWFVWTLSKVGVTRNLRRASESMIQAALLAARQRDPGTAQAS